MRHLFRKPTGTSHIKYTRPNQEPEAHLDGKKRVRIIMFGLGYTMLVNSPSMEYALPPITNVFDETRDFIIDILMYNHLLKRVVAIEIDGPYHRKDRRAIAKTKWKHETVQEYLRLNRQILVDGKAYPYISWRFKAFEDDELVGKYALKDIEIIKELV